MLQSVKFPSAIYHLATYVFCIILWSIFYFVPSDVQSAQDLSKFQLVYPEVLIVNDWHKELSYLGVMKEAISSGRIPWFVEGLSKIVKGGNAFLGVPIYVAAPHVILLAFLDPFEFHLLNHVACLTIGFWGCVLFQRRWGLSPSAFFFFAVSFNFYGGFALKIAAYGPSMMGYYLSIFVILLLTDIHESKKEKNEAVFSRNAVWLAICLSTVMYLGSLHYFVEWVTFICFWSFFNRSSLIEITKAGFLTFLLTAPRLLPAAFNFGSEANSRAVMGYMPSPMFFDSFFEIRLITEYPAFAWWEYSNYVGVVGCFALVAFGVYPLLDATSRQESLVKAMLPASIILFVISFWKFKLFVVPHFIPLLNVESLTTRYIFIPVMLLLFYSTINYSKYEKESNFTARVFFHLLIALHAVFLGLNLFYWRMDFIHELLEQTPAAAAEYFATLDTAAVQLGIQDALVPPAYEWAFLGGIGLAVVGVTASLYVLLKARTSKQTTETRNLN